MYKCIVFDVDGTLINTKTEVFRTYKRVCLEESGREYADEEIIRAYSVPTIKALEVLGLKDIDRANRKYHEYLMVAFRGVKPFEGILEVLETLRRNEAETGLVTSRNRDEVTDDACLQSLLKFFPHVVCASDTEKHKPDAEPLLRLLELWGSKPEEAIYIGDTFNDYMCAKNAGVDFALASWGAKNTAGIEADYVLEHPAQLLGII
ncbi:MAG: HAD family hydrolase [Clostridiales bacterium]|nr:HAD family hydrolase [Clostridiales bacterium]